MTDMAPFFADLAEGPEGATAVWLRTDDDIRIRVAHYPGSGTVGTVLLFPGRTEYVEKYGRTARDLTDAGFDVLAIDWRGQGLADKLLPDARAGHVNDFADYQRDVASMVAHARHLGLPEPYHLLAHSMGGCIGLRAVMDGLPVASAAFSAPMWGIQFVPPLRPVAWTLSYASTQMSMGHFYVPSTGPQSYAATVAFDKNDLTSDREMFDYMRRHVEAQNDLQLGGPSMRWLNQALRECRRLAQMPSPDVPALTFLGTKEAIVCPQRIRDRMAAWHCGRLVDLPGKRHEVLMEDATTRARVARELIAFYRNPPACTCLSAVN